jgi:hypothetical protein
VAYNKKSIAARYLEFFQVTHLPGNPEDPESNNSTDSSPSQFLTRDSDPGRQAGDDSAEVPRRIGHYEIDAV